jgi:aminoglycoside 3-N-acetyltransferase
VSEADLIAATGPEPVTRATLAADLRRLGVRPGGVLVVHASMSRLGWVVGGAPAVLHALLDALGEVGTLMVPAHTNHLSDPAGWSNPPVPEAWWPEVRASLPAYRPDETPAPWMGAVADTVLRRRDAVRSSHPHYSMAALGPLAQELCGSHELDWSIGPDSPLGRVADHDGQVLLLGVGHGSNTSLHVAEVGGEWGSRNVVEGAGPAIVAGRREWVTWQDVAYDEDDFETIGAAFAAETGLERVGPVGRGASRLMPQRELIQFARGWIDAHRS